MKPGTAVLALAAIVLTACGPLAPVYPTPAYPYNPRPSTQFASNGQQIYFTATDQGGQRIAYTGGPGGGMMMMGAYLTCAVCHGADARGGVHYVQMQSVDAPAIYYDALVQMLQEDTGGTPQPAGYSLANFREAVVQGKDASGARLDQVMPRWQMSDSDLNDLLAFLKTLP